MTWVSKDLYIYMKGFRKIQSSKVMSKVRRRINAILIRVPVKLRLRNRSDMIYAGSSGNDSGCRLLDQLPTLWWHMRWRPKIKQLQLSIKDRNQGVNEDCSAVGALSAASWLLIEACSIAFKKRQTTPQPKLGNSHQNSLDKSVTMTEEKTKHRICLFFCNFH